MRADSLKSASYFNGAISLGGANEREADPVYSFTAAVSRSHNFGILQGYYGAGMTAGSYQLRPYRTTNYNPTVNPSIINQHKGTYFFGGGGFDGGLNLVIGLQDFEWRIFGVETSLRQEVGRYGKLRDDLPDSAATLVVRDRFFGTAGMFTEFIGKGRYTETGFKLGWGTALGSDYRYFNFSNNYFPNSSLRFRYLSLNVHVTNNRYTGYIQTNFATKANAFILGMNYRISQK